MKTINLVLFLTALLPLLFITNSCADLDLTSDHALISLFTENESAFKLGVKMMKRHPELINVGPKVILSHSYRYPVDVEDRALNYRKVLSDADWNVFEGLFKQLHLRAGIKVYPAGVIYFGVNGVSIWNGDSEKGIVYSEKALAPVFEDLDHGRIEPKTAYKQIKPSWYIYLAFYG